MQSTAGSSNEERRLIRKVDDLRKAVFRTQNQKEQENAIQECAKIIPSQYLEVNRSAISLLVNVFKEHEELQATIINKAYDMAEEGQLEVRYQAIDFIVDLSRQSPKWTSRNADVLIQLLAADSEEYDKICQSITTHLSIEPAATLRTLCRFLNPADSDINTTPDLRNKLYTYLTAQNLAQLNQPALQGFHEGLVKAIPSSSFTELSIIVHDLLIPYLGPGDQGLPLVKALLQRALVFFRTSPFDSAAAMGVTKGARNVVIKLGSPNDLRLELLSFLTKPEVLACRVRLDLQGQIELLKFLGESLDIPLDELDPESENYYLASRNNVADDFKGWAKILLTCRDQLWETAVPLLQTVLDRRRDDPQWQPDAAALERLSDRLSSPNLPQAVMQQTKLAKLMIEDINVVRPAPPTITKEIQPPARSTVAPPGVQPLKSYGPPPKRKAEDPTPGPKIPLTSTPPPTIGIKGAAANPPRSVDARPPIRPQASRDTPPASLLQRLALDRTPSSSPVPRTDSGMAEGKDSERPNKRRRHDEGTASTSPPTVSKPTSLLSRMNSTSSPPGTSLSKSAPQVSIVPSSAPVSGLRIGGAASNPNGSKASLSTASAPPTPVSSVGVSPSGPPQGIRAEISLRGAAAAAAVSQATQRNRTVSDSAARASEGTLPPKPVGLSIKGASSVSPPTPAAGPPGQLGFQKALAGLGKTDSLPQRPRDSIPPPAQPTQSVRPPAKKQKSLLARFSDSPTPQQQTKGRASLADRMDLG